MEISNENSSGAPRWKFRDEYRKLLKFIFLIFVYCEVVNNCLKDERYNIFHSFHQFCMNGGIEFIMSDLKINRFP